MTKEYKFQELDREDHPFPTEELYMLDRLTKEKMLTPEDLAMISGLILRYCELRAEVFHDI